MGLRATRNRDLQGFTGNNRGSFAKNFSTPSNINGLAFRKLSERGNFPHAEQGFRRRIFVPVYCGDKCTRPLSLHSDIFQNLTAWPAIAILMACPLGQLRGRLLWIAFLRPDQETHHMPFASIKGANLYYEDIGMGRPISPPSQLRALHARAEREAREPRGCRPRALRGASPPGVGTWRAEDNEPNMLRPS